MSIHVDLWLWPLDRGKDELEELAWPLSDHERLRSQGFIKPVDRTRYIAARGRLRQILSGYTGTAPGLLEFHTIARGKPVLHGGPAFNLSHADGWAALAVAPDHPALELGIDIEAIRPINPALATKAFSPLEQAEMRRLLPADWMHGFFNGWTRKEAVIKATGHGLGVDLKSFDVSLIPDAPARVLHSRGPLPAAADWTLVNLDTGPGFCGAVAAVTRGAPLGPIVLREGRLPLFGAPLPAHGSAAVS